VIILTTEEKLAFNNFYRFYLLVTLMFIISITFLIYFLESKSYKDYVFSQMRILASQYTASITVAAMKKKEANYSDFEIVEGYNYSFYDNRGTRIFTTSTEPIQIDLKKNFYLSQGHYILVDSGSLGHLGVSYIVIKENLLDLKLKNLIFIVVCVAIFAYLLIALFGYFLSRKFISPIKEQRLMLNNFIKDTTHELNTPISGLLLCMSMPNPCTDKNLNRMRISTKRVAEIYHDLTYLLLDDKKNFDTNKVDEINLKEVLDDHIENFKELAIRKKIILIYNAENVNYKIDKESFLRLSSNIIGNAIKYTNDGTINITLNKKQFIVEDTGIGIENDKLQNIFNRFYRATNEKGGFGIGLNIVHKICTLYNITIVVKSKEQKGSTFSFKFN